MTRTAAIIMPDDVAEEKVKALLALGAQVERVRPASIVDKKQVRHPTSPVTISSLILSAVRRTWIGYMSLEVCTHCTH